MSDNTSLLTVAVLLEELQEVTDWRMLGAYLNVPRHALDKINIEHHGVVEHCKMYMLQYWLDTTVVASWKDVTRALEQINMLVLAAKLKWKYLRTSPATAAYGAIDLDQVSESKLLIHQHIQKQGQLKGVCALKMLLCGPPETGKTTTMLRLTNNLRCIDPNGLQFPGTVLSKPHTIQLRHMLIEDKKIWNFEESVKLEQSLYSLILDPSHTTGVQTAISDDRAGSSAKQDTAAVWNIDLEEVTQLAETGEWVEVKEKLTEFERITILYVIDSGGQPECHEILPLLLDGHVLSLIFLDLTKELGDKHPVLFQTGKTCAQKPLSNLTTGEVIQRILTSVSSLRSDSCKSFAVFVGTYLDKATQRQVLDLDRAVQRAFKVFIDENIVCPVKEELTKYIVTLDNTSTDQGDIESLRTLILKIVNEQFCYDQKDGVPTGWMLLHLLLRHKYQEKGWCTMAECIATAASCGITEKELPLVLKYIHKNYGTILYYPDVLKDIVICDTDAILSPLRSAFEFVFGCKFVTKKKVTKDIRSTGEISQDDLEYCFRKDGVSLSTPYVIALFKHCHIISEMGSKKFFMPCLLQTDNNIIEEANDSQKLALLNPAPILFIPTSKFQRNCATPLGVFSALVVEMCTDGKWSCNEFRFKNRIQFDVVDRTSGRKYTLELRLYATYIELRHIDGLIDSKMLVAFQRELCDALNCISQQFGHTKGIKWNWGFYCPGSLKKSSRPHLALVKRDVPAVQDMTCIFDPPCRKRITDLEEKHKKWFERAICEGSSHLSQQQKYWLQPLPVQVIHASNVSLRASYSKQKEQELKSQLAKVQQESKDRGEQLSKLENENYNLHKERLIRKHTNELQQEELKRLQQTGSPAVTSSVSSATVENAAVEIPPTHHSPGEQTTAATPPTVDQAEEVIHAYDVSLRASKEKEQQLQSQLAKVEQESKEMAEQLSKLEVENVDLQKERLVLKHANELQQEELKSLQQTVTSCDEARLAASEEEQQLLLQVVKQWKKMFHAREMQISQLQNENKQLKEQLSASDQQQVKEDHNVKEQSNETDFTALKLALSLHGKQDGSCSVATVDTGVQANYLAVAPDFLRGVEVYGETVLEVVGDKPQKLEWPGYGFYIEVPDGALTPGVTASVAVKVILGGQFTLPDENSQLISAIYWISSSEVFLKEVAVNIQHYAVITSEEQCSKLRFIVAKCSQEVLPYTFREKEGLFNAHTQYGAIKVKRFSIFTQIGPKGIDSRITSLKFYKPRPTTRTLVVDFDFVVLYNHEPFLKVVREWYHSNKYQEDRQNQILVFEKKKIVLDLPAGGSEPKVVDGWKILPMTYPQIEKCDIERYRCGKNVAGCTIELMWTGDGEPKELYYQVNIIGAKEPANYFHLRYSPQAVVSTSTVPDTPSGATPTAQDVTASQAEHSKQEHNYHKAAAAFCDLNQECSNQHFAKISKLIVDWREIAPFLDLTEADEIAIRDSTPHSVPTQKMAMLRKWKQKLGTKATYERLCQAFEDCEKGNLVELVKQLAASSSSSKS